VPRVSVIIPNYNHAPFLRQRMRSVLDQTFNDLEVIVLDDASTDDSLRVLAEFSGEARVRVVPSSTNSGNTFIQWNRGAAMASGEYLWFAESDDYADQRLLERLVGMLEANLGCGMACCESWYVYGNEPPTSRTNESHLPENERWRRDFVADGRTECAQHLISQNTMPNASAVVIRRALYEKCGGADESMRLCGDWMLWAKILMMSDLAHVGEPLNFYRCHTAAVRRKNLSTPATMIEVYRISTYIARRAPVSPEKLEQVLAMRAERFIQAWWEQRFGVADAWRVYRAARRVDRKALRRIWMRWCRWRLGLARQRLHAPLRRRQAPEPGPVQS
jgi:glycosyltransferase involved in cell wall biosynthesis